jgi:acyl-CoA thioesterase I
MAFKSFVHVAVAAALTLSVAGAAAAQPVQVVAFGDSLMAGYGLDPGQSFPEQLEASLRERGHDVVIVNAGVSGDTTSAGLARLDWSIPEDADIVILGLGANDMLRGVSPSVTRANLDQMLAALDARGVEVLMVGMLAAPNLGSDYGTAFDAIYPELAEAYGVPLYPFFLDGVTAQGSMLLDDGMHPNADGVARMVEGVLPFVEPLLDAEEG